MIHTVSMTARQRADGAPINVRARWVWDKDGWNLNNNIHLGATTTNTPPTNISAFAGSVESVTNGQANYLTRDVRAADAITAKRAITEFNCVLPVADPFLAGRYLWAVDDASGGAVTAYAGPYLIR